VFNIGKRKRSVHEKSAFFFHVEGILAQGVPFCNVSREVELFNATKFFQQPSSEQLNGVKHAFLERRIRKYFIHPCLKAAGEIDGHE